MARSMVTRANSAHKRLISIFCSAVTCGLLVAPFKLPARHCRLTLARLHKPRRLLLVLLSEAEGLPKMLLVSACFLEVATFDDGDGGCIDVALECIIHLLRRQCGNRRLQLCIP